MRVLWTATLYQTDADGNENGQTFDWQGSVLTVVNPQASDLTAAGVAVGLAIGAVMTDPGQGYAAQQSTDRLSG